MTDGGDEDELPDRDDVDTTSHAEGAESGSAGAPGADHGHSTPDESEQRPRSDAISSPPSVDPGDRRDSIDGASTEASDRDDSSRETDDLAGFHGAKVKPGPKPERTPNPKPGPESLEDQHGPGPKSSPIRWALRTDHGLVVFLRDVLSSVATVLLVAVLLFAISGIWPPLVAVESGSMEPHMHRGDLVFLMDEHRFAPDAAVEGTGVVTHRKGHETGYWSFGNHGNVVVYRADGGSGTPIIHRARFYVEEGDDWVAEASDEYLRSADTCAEVTTCPAPHDGFITKGDHNPSYDQVGIARQSTVVKPSWIKGRAKVRIPWLGYVRLWLGSTASPLTTGSSTSIVGLVSGMLARLELAIAGLGGVQIARTIE
jgi:signal peptidase